MFFNKLVTTTKLEKDETRNVIYVLVSNKNHKKKKKEHQYDAAPGILAYFTLLLLAFS